MRRPAMGSRPRQSNLATFPAPTAGWVSNRNLATAAKSGTSAAYVLQNFYPGTETAILRRGSEKYAFIGDGDQAVTALMRYRNGSNQKFFAATEEDIYDITTVADPDVSPTASVTGQTGGNWVSAQFQTTGGTYLVCVNGEDSMQLYDGSVWWPITDQPINQLAFDTQTANFTVGATLTGGTSGATATILRVTDNGTSGILYLRTITGGPFQNNETITDGSGGSALADGINSVLFGAFTGVDTSNLSFVWSYKNRLFFIEKDSLNVWYLAIDSITGAANKFPMGGVFAIGGAGLTFGASWSLGTSGDGGLSEQCVFVSAEGEVAVYQGTNPSDASAWGKVGLYQIGRPLGKLAYVRIGGDLVIATDIGFIPLSQAVQRSVATLAPAAVSFAIEPNWNAAAIDRRSADWSAIVWPEAQMVLVSPPTPDNDTPISFIANVRTMAWGEYTGWDARCFETYEGRLFFGSAEGRIVEANVTGADEGVPYTGISLSIFDDLQSPATRKLSYIGRVTRRETNVSSPSLTVLYDYTEDFPTAPSAGALSGSAVWGTGIWGTSVWSETSQKTVTAQWVSVGGSGYSMAPCVMITSGDLRPLDTEIIRVEVTFQGGDIVS